MQTEDKTAQDIIRRFDSAVSLRGNLDSHCEEIAKRVLPNYSGSFTSGGMARSQGEKRTDEMVDATAAVALGRFAAAMESMLTPRNSRWHRMVPSDKSLLKNRMARLWFEDATERLFKHRYAPKANFASQQHEIYTALGAFGTGSMFIDALKGGGIRYRAIHLAEIFFLENHQGLIDTAFRKFPLTARQAEQWFGRDKLPEKVLAALADTDSSKADKEFFFIHCVRPREDYDPGRKDFKGMAYSSCYVAVDDKATVMEGGYNTFPYAISRYVVAPGELYGRSPAMTALPAIKVLNEQKRTVLKQGHRTVDPVLLTTDDGVVDTFSLKPGAINAGGVSADGKLLVQALPVGNLTQARELMDAERFVINDVFLVTLFQILVDTPQMTATEVIERAREKGALLSPTMGRQQSEALGPQIEREVDVMAMQGLLPPMPQILREARGQFDIEYDSPLSRAQKAESAAGTMRTIGWASEIFKITQDPSVLDPFDWDVIIPDLGDINAMPVRYLASEEKIAQKRAGRQEAQAAQQAIDAAPAVASLMKTPMAPGAGA